MIEKTKRRLLAALSFGAFTALLCEINPPLIYSELALRFPIEQFTRLFLPLTFIIFMALGIICCQHLLKRITIKNLAVLGSLFVFAGCIVGLFTNSIGLFAIARLIQGFGSGILFTLPVCVAFKIYHQQNGYVFGIITFIVGFAYIVFPTINQFLRELLGWQAIFYLPALLCIINIIVSVFTIKNNTISKNGKTFSQSISQLIIPLKSKEILMNSVLLTICNSLIICSFIVTIMLIYSKFGCDVKLLYTVLIPTFLSFLVINPIVGRIFDRGNVHSLVICGLFAFIAGAVSVAIASNASEVLAIIIAYTIQSIGAALLIQPLQTKIILSADENNQTAAAIISTLLVKCVSVAFALVLFSVFSAFQPQATENNKSIVTSLAGNSYVLAIIGAVILIAFIFINRKKRN